MIQIFEITGRLAGANELIGGINTNRYRGASIKKKETARCAEAALILRPIIEPVGFSITWFEPNRRRDIDNVAFGTKFILDGLMEAGKLPNDGRKWVKSITHYFPDPDPKNPRIAVAIEPYFRSGDTAEVLK